MKKFGIVYAGSVQACRDDANGNRVIMAEVSAREIFGEAFSYLKRNDEPVYIYAPDACTVLGVSMEKVLEHSEGLLEKKLLNRFLTMMAQRTLKMHDRIVLVCQNTIREKILMYLDTMRQKENKENFRVVRNGGLSERQPLGAFPRAV